jgi:hypothetical protein
MAPLFRAIAAILAVGLLSPLLAHSASGMDNQKIVAKLNKQFDRPDAPLLVSPVTVQGNYAIAGWIQGNKGGRVLLQKEDGQWRILVCGGDGLTQENVLETTGMPFVVAKKLAVAVRVAESKLSMDKRRQFDSFENMVRIDAGSESQGQHHLHDSNGAHAAPGK